MARLTPEQLEQQIHAVLREQPTRRAPMSLEARVMGEIARRQAQPWWQKSFSYWPSSVRLAFVVVATGLMAAMVLGSMQVFGVVSAETTSQIVRPFTDAWATLRAAGSALASLKPDFMSGISHQWLYLALGVIGAAYAMMIGLGATAYRVLWAQHR